MVISHSHRFIYWKPHKVASTSVMYALSRLCNENDSCGGIAGKVEEDVDNLRRNMTAFSHLQTMGNHAAPEEIRDISDMLWGSALWQSYYKFTIVRNPWDWALSLLDYARNQLGSDINFDDVVKHSQRRYWFSDSDQPLADFYIRYEHLNEDYNSVCQHLQLPGEPLPHFRVGSRDKSRPYWEFYTEANRNLIAQIFAQEIEYFSYQFGE
ncbi:MAG: sulfotransferase family 2 domain-containing protein [Pseudomonadales bacterium]